MTLLRAFIGRRWARAWTFRLSTTARTELDLDGATRVRHMNKRDAAADKEPEAILERLRGGHLFSDPYPPGSLLYRLSNLFEKSEGGDGAARAELESVVEGLDSSDKLLFYRLREQFMATQLETLQPGEIPAMASDEDWRQVMAEAVPRFQEIGRHLQDVELDKKRVSSESALTLSHNQPAVEDVTSPGGDAVSEQEPAANMPLYSEHSDIHAHTEQDIGRFFDFNTTVLPEGLAGTIKSEFALTKSPKMLIRSAAYRIMSKCRALGLDGVGYRPGTTIIFCGTTPGSGRSAALNYVTAWARSRPEWLTVFVPDADRFPQSGKRIIPSRLHPQLFTQPDLQQEWLRELLRNQGDVLARLPLRKPHQEMMTLRDLVQYGAEKPDTDDVIFDVFDELRAVTDCHVMVAVDRYNVWLRASSYRDPESGKPIPASNLALIRCFMDLYESAPVNGVTIASLTTGAPVPPTAHLKRESDDANDIVTLPIYSAAEINTVIGHWVKSGWLVDIPDDMVTFKNYVSALSGRNPREVFRVLQSL